MRRVILLEKLVEPNGELHFRVALWADVPAARQAWVLKGPLPPNCAAATRVSDGSVSAAETTAFQNGALVERVDEARYPAGTTQAQAQTDLISRYQAFQVEVNAWNPWARYGTSWDDAGAGAWTGKVTA